MRKGKHSKLVDKEARTANKSIAASGAGRSSNRLQIAISSSFSSTNKAKHLYLSSTFKTKPRCSSGRDFIKYPTCSNTKSLANILILPSLKYNYMRNLLLVLTASILLFACKNDTKIASIKNDTAATALNYQKEILTDNDKKQIENAIIGLENEWAEVIVNHNMAVLEKVLAPSYVGTGVENGVAGVTNKKEMIEQYLTGDHTITSAVNSNMKVYITSKDLAVAIGEVTEKGKYNNKKDLYRVWRWTDTYAKLDGRWQCISNHSSRVK